MLRVLGMRLYIAHATGFFPVLHFATALTSQR